jgi:hypothetical protein
MAGTPAKYPIVLANQHQWWKCQMGAQQAHPSIADPLGLHKAIHVLGRTLQEGAVDGKPQHAG